MTLTFKPGEVYEVWEGDPLGQRTGNSIRMVTIPMCPDHLQYSHFGVADCWRGRVIRGFFWLMRAWRVK